MNHYTFEELSVGMEESFSVTVTEEMHNKFTELSGDINPMHLSEEYAKEHGYAGKLVYGMLTASFYSTLVGVYLPGEHCVFHEIRSTFNAPVYAGDTLTIHGEIVQIHEDFRRIKIKAYIVNQEGTKVSLSTLTVGVV
ncbi:MAG: MaoC family dehydratase [Lachnospiraceae bacterium]|nr:MaoC family dehydratase [Lachnospiraceae bacterium]